MTDAIAQQVLAELRELRQDYAAQRAEFAVVREMVESLRKDTAGYATERECYARHMRSNEAMHSGDKTIEDRADRLDERTGRIGKEVQTIASEFAALRIELVGPKGNNGKIGGLTERVSSLEGDARAVKIGAVKLLAIVAASGLGGAAIVRMLL